jgi:pimeloyl-ACP methyl ester carboxylesterase
MTMFTDRRLVILAAISLLLVVVAISFGLMIGGASQRKQLETKVTYPILFIHGLGGEGNEWLDAGLVDYLELKGLRYGGVLGSKDGEVHHEEFKYPASQGDFFAIHISDSFQGLELWSIELTAAIQWIRGATGAPRVVLVGFSAGGVAIRKYLVDHFEDHGVAKAVTISSPHRGSELASLAKLKRDLDEADHTVPALILDKLGETVGKDPDSELIQQLVPERDNPFLAELNSARHPLDVEYSCVLTYSGAFPREWRELQLALKEIRQMKGVGSFLGDFLSNMAMNISRIASGEGPVIGDGAVLVSSQDLRRVAFFEANPDAVQCSLPIESSHLTAQERYSILVEAIGSNPSFGQVNHIEHGQLVLNFEDYFAGLADIEVRDPDNRRVDVSSPVAFRVKDKSVGRVRIGPLPERHIPYIDIIIRSIGREGVYGLRISFRDGFGERPTHDKWVDFEGGFQFDLGGLSDIPSRAPSGLPWDLDGSGPDPMVVLFVGNQEEFRSRVLRDASQYVTFDQRTKITANLLEQKVRLELWDMDGPEIPQPMGEAQWNPGELPFDEGRVIFDSGVSLRFQVEPMIFEKIHWQPLFEME